MTALEKAVQRDVVNFFTGLGCDVYKFSQPRRTMQTPGIPDLWIFCPRKRLAFWWETKRSDLDTRTDKQKDFAALCQRTGTKYGFGALHAARTFAKAFGIMWAAA